MTAAAPAAMDAARWQAASPLLDELLELDEPARAARLDALRQSDPALADDLAGMLGRLDRLDDEGFLEAPALPAPLERAGQTVGAYTLERELGAGGMGSVWLARRTDGRYESRVAIKFLQAGLFGGGNAGRFEREGHILGRLDHPHIARLLDAGVTPGPGQPYLVLEYIDGEPIDRHCEARSLDVKERLRLFLDVLDAVAHAHNRLILHRDLKPSNILVTREGRVKLLDFGIAKLLDDGGASAELTQQAGQAFTPLYAAPEQLQGGEVTTATDVYALGVLLYLLLSGRHPVELRTTNRLDQMRAVVEQPARTLSATVVRTGGTDALRRARPLRGDLDTIVGKALKKDPAERYANAAALADDLRRHLASVPIAARPDHLAYRAAKFLRRNLLAVSAAALASLGLLIGAAVARNEAREAREQQEQAEGLIEFMLGNLRDRLKPVGRLDVLDAVGVKALEYYDRQPPARLGPASLGRVAQAEHLRGEIAEQRGSLKEASALFERAARRTAQQLARFPDDPQRVFEHAQSEYWVGYVALRRGDAAAAEQSFLAYRRLADRLLELEPGQPRPHAERAYAEMNLGVVYRNTGRRPEAERAFQAAAQAWRAALPKQPRAALELANSLGFLANIRAAAGDYAGAIELQSEKLEALARMPRADVDQSARYLRANGLQEIARLELVRGQWPAALEGARGAVRAFEALVAYEPGKLDTVAEALGARLLLLDAQLGLGLTDEARLALPQVQADLRRLLAAEAGRLSWSVVLQGWVLRVRAQLAASPAAVQAITRELSVYLDGLAPAPPDKVTDARANRSVGGAAIALGDLLAEAGRSEAARERWRAARAWLRPLAPSGEPAALALLAQAELRLGRLAEVRSLSDKLRESAYRHPVHADLERRLAMVARAAPGQEGDSNE